MPINETERAERMRQSFTGRSLTASQLDEAVALAGIMHREIQKSGSFRDKLTDYAHSFARSERFDALKGEEIVRDAFKASYGETMNEMRERLMEKETAFADNATEKESLGYARKILEHMSSNAELPFYRAYDRAALHMAARHGITESGAKSFMKEAFAKSEGRELYDAAKEIEAGRESRAPASPTKSHRRSAQGKRRPGPAR